MIRSARVGLACVIEPTKRSPTMWSRFEKLKDNITQIASDVLDSQDEELDDGRYNGSLEDVHLRDSDGEDENSPEPHPREVRDLCNRGHVFFFVILRFRGLSF
jgi:hypothetical protein